MQDRLAGKFAVDKPAGYCADLAPWRLDGKLRPQLLCGDQIGEQCQADAGALDAHQFVKQGEPVEPRSPGCEKPTAFKGRLRGVGHPKCHATAARLEHTEGRRKRGTAERVEYQPERPVRLGSGEFAPEDDSVAAPFGDGGAIFLPTDMAPDLSASRRGQLAGEMPHPA